VELLWQGFSEALQLLARGDPELLQISGLSLAVSLLATLLSALVGVPSGVVLATSRFPGRGLLNTLVNTGMGIPPVVVGLVVSILLWRTGPFGPLQLIYTPAAMVIAQFLVAAPIAAGLTRAAVEALDAEQIDAFRVYGAKGLTLGRELLRAAFPGVVLATVAAFGRAIAEVGASLMVGGNIAGQTRVLTTAISLETSRGGFARAIALGLVLLALAFLVNVVFSWASRRGTSRWPGRVLS
jgi:ABC-type tungstate transport system substrate-binding protein